MALLIEIDPTQVVIGQDRASYRGWVMSLTDMDRLCALFEGRNYTGQWPSPTAEERERLLRLWLRHRFVVDVARISAHEQLAFLKRTVHEHRGPA